MAEQERCQCQSAAHGHRPGKCPHPAADEGLCKECNEENRAAEATRDSTASRRIRAPIRDWCEEQLYPLRPSGLPKTSCSRQGLTECN